MDSVNDARTLRVAESPLVRLSLSRGFSISLRGEVAIEVGKDLEAVDEVARETRGLAVARVAGLENEGEGVDKGGVAGEFSVVDGFGNVGGEDAEDEDEEGEGVKIHPGAVMVLD